MRKIEEYATMNANTAEALDRIVNKHLAAGWELFGTPSAAKGGNYGGELFVQTMVLYKKAGTKKS